MSDGCIIVDDIKEKTFLEHIDKEKKIISTKKSKIIDNYKNNNLKNKVNNRDNDNLKKNSKELKKNNQELNDNKLKHSNEDLSNESNDNLILKGFKEIIDNNNYINNYFSKNKIDETSLSYLIKDCNLSQSNKIKLGIVLEKILTDYVLKNNVNLENIKTHTKKGEKEKDHIFKDEKNKIIYYAELKSNLNLDTEKSKSTTEKCLFILNELRKNYTDYTIKMYLVSLRYLNKQDIPNFIINKYQNILSNICGLNDYLISLNIDNTFKNENEYSLLLKYIVKKIIKN